jgi:two-component system response regulator
MDTLFNILFADDDIDEHIFFKEAINKINVVGHNVISVYDGVQLLDYLMKRGMYKNSKGPFPDIIIIDLNMPVMDGIETVKAIKAQKELSEIPVYVLSVSSNVTNVNTCRELGCAGYLQKQKKNDKLTKIIETILEKEASRI